MITFASCFFLKRDCVQITDNLPDIVQLLLKAGASVNQTNQSGWAPLHQATRLGHHRMARLLLDWGAETLTSTKLNTSQVVEVDLNY